MQDFEITVKDFDALRNKDTDSFVLLDIRQPWEVSKAQIKPSLHIPFTELLDHTEDLPHDKKIIIYCHHGIRSMNACVFLREQGFKDVLSLAGGIDAWAREIDPSIELY